MSTPHSLISPDMPSDYPRAHDQLRTYIGDVGGKLFLCLANVPWLGAKLEEPLHGSEDTSCRQTDSVVREEDARVPGFTEVYVNGARTELRRDNNADVLEVELELYAHDPALVVNGWAPDRDARLSRVDTVGVDNRGNAYINGSDDHTRPTVTDEGALTPDWRRAAGADQVALRVAAVSLKAIDLGWPLIVDPGLRSSSMFQLEAWHNVLGDMLGEQTKVHVPSEWYAQLPGATKIADRVETF